MLLLNSQSICVTALALWTVKPLLQLLEHASLDGVSNQSNCAFAFFFVVLVSDACDSRIEASLLKRLQISTAVAHLSLPLL